MKCFCSAEHQKTDLDFRPNLEEYKCKKKIKIRGLTKASLTTPVSLGAEKNTTLTLWGGGGPKTLIFPKFQYVLATVVGVFYFL